MHRSGKLRSQQLEAYTMTHPQEVLVVRVQVNDGIDEIAIFKGFSSSLTRPTEFDPDVPMLSDEDDILGIDRLQAPFNPQDPQYIEQNLSWLQMSSRLPSID